MNEQQENSVSSTEDAEEAAELRIAKRYLGNVLKASQISVIRVVVKTPKRIYNPDFQNDIHLWEQYWSSAGELLFERPLDISKF